MNGYTKTDDLQYVRKTGDFQYHFIEGRWAEDKFLLCKGPIDIRDYMTDKGEYTDEGEQIINSYYSSVSDFDFTDPDTRNWLFAEMCFESLPYYEVDWQIVAEEDIEEKIKKEVEIAGGVLS